MEMKTSELTGAALDWAVAKCEGFKYEMYEHNRKKWENGLHRPQHWQPSTDWAQGGTIIEREKIALDFDGKKWCASNNHKPLANYGLTPLIAAMRCYVVSKLGDTVDVPKELF